MFSGGSEQGAFDGSTELNTCAEWSTVSKQERVGSCGGFRNDEEIKELSDAVFSCEVEASEPRGVLGPRSQ